jgi:RNA polymerase sigma-70 factor, ECF subfamily
MTTPDTPREPLARPRLDVGGRPAPVVTAGGAGDGDAALVARMGGGDERALGALYDRWSPVVHTLVQHILRDAGEAEDVVEETFWQAWRQAGRYDAARGGVSTWLLTIARSRALDRLRAMRRQRAELVPLAEATDSVASEAPTPGAAAELGERATLVASALRELPAEQRQALELAYYSGLSQSEIADRTGQPLGTVKTRMRLAMQKLRTRLAVLRGDA